MPGVRILLVASVLTGEAGHMSEFTGVVNWMGASQGRIPYQLFRKLEAPDLFH